MLQRGKAGSAIDALLADPAVVINVALQCDITVGASDNFYSGYHSYLLSTKRVYEHSYIGSGVVFKAAAPGIQRNIRKLVDNNYLWVEEWMTSTRDHLSRCWARGTL
jgi:hypothetical protein